jgi:hypothetical protein
MFPELCPDNFETDVIKFRVFWEVLPCSHLDVDRRFRGACFLHLQGDEFQMEAARPSETSVDIEFISQQYIPEDSELRTRRLENLKSHVMLLNL